MAGEGKGKGNGNGKGKSKEPKQKKAKAKAGPRSRADRQLAAGTGKAATRAFGAVNRRGGSLLRCWDAFHPSHLALPSSTGPYTVVRTTTFFTTNAKYIQFGAFQRQVGSAPALPTGEWSNVCAIASVDESVAINAASNTRYYAVPFPGNDLIGSSHTCVPAAVSVQLINSAAINTTDGLVFGAVCNTQLDYNGRAETWNDVSTEVVSYFRPRLMSAAKLALRGVHANSFPINVPEVSNFKPMTTSVSASLGTLNGGQVRPVGFAPIVFINQDSPENRTQYTFLVCVEWRVRFDIGNPAVASHTHHPATSAQDWDAAIRQASSMGHGIADIVESVASAGEAASRLASLM